MTRLIIALIFSLACWHVQGAEQPPAETAQPHKQENDKLPAQGNGLPERVFPAEQLDYEVTCWVGNAANIRVNVGPLHVTKNGAFAHFITYNINTTGIMSRIYIIKGSSSVLMDADTLLPYEYAENVKSGIGVTGGNIKRYKLEYDRAQDVIRYYNAEDENGPLMYRRARKIPPLAHHFSSLVYLFRYHDKYAVGETITVPLSDRKRDLKVIAKVLREENYVTPIGLAETAYVLNMESDFGAESIKGTVLTVWLDKREHYPVRIDAKTRWGTICAKLVKRTVTEDDVPADEECRDNPSEI